MSWKVLIFLVLAVLIAYWAFSGLDVSSGLFNSEINEALGPWIRDNIDSHWLENKPAASEIVMQKFSFSNPVLNKETEKHTCKLTIKGFYTQAESGKQVKFKTTHLLEINKKNVPTKFKLLD